MSRYMNEDDEMMSSEEYASEDAEIAAEVDDDDQDHLMADEVYGTQTKILHITFNGSLTGIAKGQVKTTWSLNDEMKKELKHVTASNNRSLAKDDDKIGDLSKAVLLEASIIQERSNFPVDIGVEIPGLKPNTLSSSQRYNWIITQETPTTTVKHSIFEPDSIFTKKDYKKSELLDMLTLDAQVDFNKDPSGKIARVDSDGFVWWNIMNNCAQGNFQGYEDHLFELDEQAQRSRHAIGLPVPTEIAKPVYDNLKSRLLKLEKSFVDLRKFRIKFERADGEHWNSKTNIIGEGISLDEDSNAQINDMKLTEPYSATLKVELKYIMYGDK